jgi:hypothetical protein
MSGMVSSQQQGTAAGPIATVAAAVPAVPPSTVAAAVPAVPPFAYTAAGAALFNFNNPVRLPPALFGNIVEQRDIWAAYSRTNPYSVYEKQRIENWD